MGPHQPLGDVSTTGLGMALVRAGERGRPDRLFDDPYAEAFLAAAPEAFADEAGATTDPAVLEAVFSVFSFNGVMRTRFFDDEVLAAAAAGCRQVVLLAAGLDTRAFRLAWPAGVHLFEVDLPAVFTFKERVLTGQGAVPRCERTIIPVDLRDDWPARLAEAGFDHTEPTAWLAEGLLVYLSADEAARLLTSIGDLSAPLSTLFFEHGDIADAALLDQAQTMPGMERFTALWKSGLNQDSPAWLGRHGWEVSTHHRATLAARYHRPVPDHSGGDFITSVRRGATSS